MKILKIIWVLTFTFLYSTDIKGRVTYSGPDLPRKNYFDRINTAEPVCGPVHTDKNILSEDAVWDKESGALGNCIVWLKGVSNSVKAPSDPVVLDQKGCVYKPHVFGIQVNQTLKIQNSDKAAHNVHTMPDGLKNFTGKNSGLKEWNKSTPAGIPATTKFEKSQDLPFYVKCDIHPWMRAWILVQDHPYFAITDENGNYTIKDVPPGEYEIVCWWEYYNYTKRNKKQKKLRPLKSSQIVVGDNTVNQDFDYSRNKKPK